MKSRFPWLPALGSLGYVLLYVPIIVMVIYSFNASTRSSAVWAGWSFRWYVEIWSDEALRSSLLNSLKIAFIAATISIVLGTMVAFALRRFGGFRLRRLLAGLASLPLVMPEVVTGLMMVLFFDAFRRLIGWPEQNGVTTVVIAHSTFGLAFAAVVVQARLADFGEDLVEAASDLGASRVDSFLSVTLPIILPALIAGWLLAFTLSFEDVVITQFVNGPGSTTLPVEIYSRVKLGVKPEINVLATLMIAVVAVGLSIAIWVQARMQRQAERLD